MSYTATQHTLAVDHTPYHLAVDHTPYHVVVDHSLVLPPFQHGAVPLNQMLWLENHLLCRVAVEDALTSLARGAHPNMGSAEPARMRE